MRIFLCFLTYVAMAFGLAGAVSAEGHLRALVIGNGAYQNVPAAETSITNAEEVKLALGALGFDVNFAKNIDTVNFWRIVAEFSSTAVQSGPDALNVVYFAGRAAVENDRTFLLPVDADAGAGIASRAILLDQIITLSGLGGGAVYVVLDLEKAASVPDTQFGVGLVSAPAMGLVAIIERMAEAELADGAGEAFAVAFSDETQLPNLRMDAYVELVAAGAQSYSEDQLKVSFFRGQPSDVFFNREDDDEKANHLLRLRAYDLARTGSDDELAAFSSLYPDYELSEQVAAVDAESGNEAELTLLRPIVFSAPISGAGEPLEGLTIGEIIKLKPKHSPIEGLPSAAWENKTCANCHNWNEAALCEHGKRYQGDIWNRAGEKAHPLGGSFKKVIRAWAADGCLSE